MAEHPPHRRDRHRVSTGSRFGGPLSAALSSHRRVWLLQSCHRDALHRGSQATSPVLCRAPHPSEEPGCGPTHLSPAFPHPPASILSQHLLPRFPGHFSGISEGSDKGHARPHNSSSGLALPSCSCHSGCRDAGRGVGMKTRPSVSAGTSLTSQSLFRTWLLGLGAQGQLPPSGGSLRPHVSLLFSPWRRLSPSAQTG